ncbi:maleylpyruvate isomerase family mycothiol-dependent enzyme [Rugosimonospora africana]|uniref:TIGR03086 family protein n=1 Tax=Rugosimonospora africana TaxID=556532 RepID=A0A8J3QYV6_9ACTN|nr:maleylpyruvate isomerase family mycothiol-dependent enzyme [Rugosimonospora africana]GIH18602.1 TIGR03086 family protein [Rugosimonospora africana]
MTILSEQLIDRFVLASAGFERRLRAVWPDQWHWPTPCTEWDVRQLVNHTTRGNLNYIDLLEGGSAAQFLRLRDADALDSKALGGNALGGNALDSKALSGNALGGKALDAYTRSVRECAEAFARPDALRQILDYPLGRVTGEQALAVRLTDSAIHTWDLARAIGADEDLDAGLVTWIDDHLEQIYAGLAETPTAADTTHRFFAVPGDSPGAGASRQDRLLHRMGRRVSRDPVT